MADSFDWKATIGAVAPGLATALGGPLAGAAVKVIADKVFGNPNASEADLATALALGTLTGDQIRALKQAEMEMQIELARIDQASDAAYLADTDSARKQTVALAQSGSGIAWAPVVISAIITVGFFICIYMLFVFERDWTERQAGLLNTLFGALILGFGQACNYWLGSSAGSKRAGDAVRKIAEHASK
ncbi:hypothetical protein [Variovorax sp. PMC12]|uniref:hypothetical protein n=1 Tax=Variovorax sp. PMC12 TaxID=2126319 RepID=UPI000D120545|nr:hypothetical protein [Variovorax sp. PMC12]AVQ81640.1 hypothetical protein C4F17_12160 [Variovorax sp. PMC12]